MSRQLLNLTRLSLTPSSKLFVRRLTGASIQHCPAAHPQPQPDPHTPSQFESDDGLDAASLYRSMKSDALENPVASSVLPADISIGNVWDVKSFDNDSATAVSEPKPESKDAMWKE